MIIASRPWVPLVVNFNFLMVDSLHVVLTQMAVHCEYGLHNAFKQQSSFWNTGVGPWGVHHVGQTLGA